jgi:hypothetical protein
VNGKRAGRVKNWPEDWFATAAERSALAWRGVEAQHIVATMRLVDTLDEQAVLEQLLEASKPALQTAEKPRHYLLNTPFRYRSPSASRFRRAGAAGVWYGAETLQAAAAEVAHWRWRFLSASDGLRDQELLTEHTFFQAQVQGTAIDLSEMPWLQRRAEWTHDIDYSAPQTLAKAARERSVQWIRYESARHPERRCSAVFDVEALQLPVPPVQQTWHCKATLHNVLMVHGSDRFAWSY